MLIIHVPLIFLSHSIKFHIYYVYCVIQDSRIIMMTNVNIFVLSRHTSLATILTVRIRNCNFLINSLKTFDKSVYDVYNAQVFQIDSFILNKQWRFSSFRIYEFRCSTCIPTRRTKRTRHSRQYCV